jgi:hypothetical protein
MGDETRRHDRPRLRRCLDRAPDYESGGQEFESLRARQQSLIIRAFFARSFYGRVSYMRTKGTQCPENGAQSPEIFPNSFHLCSTADSTNSAAGETEKMSKTMFGRLAETFKTATRLLTRRRIMSREEIFHAGNIGPEPSANYQKSLDMLDNVVREGITVSRQYAGLKPQSPKHFYASVLYTAMLSRSVSLIMLAPHSPWAQKMIEHWDYASAAVIVRTLLELRAAFHYLCVDECSDEEWKCRWNILNLHDCCSRIRLLEARPSSDNGVNELRTQA